MVEQDGTTAKDVTPWLSRAGQWFPQPIYAGLIVAALLAGLASVIWSWLGAVSAGCSAVAAWGFVMHSRPRTYTRRLADIAWDPVAVELAQAGILEYESSVTGRWTVPVKRHRKGAYPMARLAERQDPNQPWAVCDAGIQVDMFGNVTAEFQVQRSTAEGDLEVLLIIS